MPGEIYLSTAYLPPPEYFRYIKDSDSVIIEREENYVKQTWRNRCAILTSNGVRMISVPVMKGSQKKVPVKDVVIDYSKRWQQVHLRALISSYGRSPYFQFYFDEIEKVILSNQQYLLDLNERLLNSCMEMLKLNRAVSFTSSYTPASDRQNDLRYRLTPKTSSVYSPKSYNQVFSDNQFINGLSVLDLIFNMGPDSVDYI